MFEYLYTVCQLCTTYTNLSGTFNSIFHGLYTSLYVSCYVLYLTIYITYNIVCILLYIPKIVNSY